MNRRVDGVARVTVRYRALVVPARSLPAGDIIGISPVAQPPKRIFLRPQRLAKAAYRAELIAQALAKEAAVKMRKKARRKHIAAITGRSVAVGILLVSGYVTYDTWKTNQALRAQLEGTSSAVSKVKTTDTATAQERQQAEGRDETAVGADALAKYTVAPTLPRLLSIPKINVQARVMPMSVNGDGSLQAPINIYDAGWYTGGVRPGDKGAAVIDGHASGPTRMGLFAYLDTLKAGDKLAVERGDGVKLQYQVVETKKVPRDSVDMKELMTPKGSEEGLNLITCTGTWQQQGQTYSDRALIFTKRVS